jgi:1-acyl-sn-glycerol-3-phosphate acyltransferase
MKKIKAAFRMLAVGVKSAVYALRLRFANEDKSRVLMKKWMKSLTKTLGAKVNVIGTPAGGQGKPVMYIPNHVSYADALVMMSVIEARITAAADIANWPLIGRIAKRQKVTFIEQPKGRKMSNEDKEALVKRTCDNLRNSLDSGMDVILFPEGDMSEGVEVKRFSPGTFRLYFNELGKPHNEVIPQPVVIEVASVGGEAVEPGVSSPLREIYAQYCMRTEPVEVKSKKTGKTKTVKKRIMNKDILPHVWSLAKQAENGGLEVNLRFLDPLKSEDFEDFKAMAEGARTTIEANLQRKAVTSTPAKKVATV